MKPSIDGKKTLDIIERMKLAQIGEYKKWEKIIKKIKEKQDLSPIEAEYFSKFTRIYKNSNTTNRSKNYHTRLSEHDEKPPAKLVKKNQSFIVT